MPTEQTWQPWLERLHNLRRDKRGSHERPHKPAVLLAILDLLDRGHVEANEIALTPELVRTSRRYFDVVRQEDDQPSIENPFYLLSGDGFWKVEQPGEGPLYEPGNASSPPSMSILNPATVHGPQSTIGACKAEIGKAESANERLKAKLLKAEVGPRAMPEGS